VYRVRTPSSPVREREREREKRKKEGKRERDRRDVEYVFQFTELFLFLKVITSTLAPFTYLVFYKTVMCSSNTLAY
jgi:hypothetical protein